MESPARTSLVGRDAEMQRLAEAFALSAGGQRAVVVSGEAGIGKSRLVTDFLSTIGDAAVVTVGSCYESQDIAPFVPIRQILRQLPAAVGAEEWDAAIAPVARTLAGLLPVGLGAGLEPDLSPARVHEAVDLVFEELSATRPLVVVIEDLHWVDTSTLGLLGAILRYRTSGRRFLILTYRTDDVPRGHPLRGFLHDVDRGRLATRIELTPLPRDAVAQMAVEGRGRMAEAQELDRLIERSDGIPFFIEELLGLADGQLADSLRDVVLARYDRMSEGTKRVLRVLAIGESIDHRVLAGVADELGIPGDAFEDALREAASGGIITVADEAYRFRHALSREAVADEILPGEKDRLHAAYAKRLDFAADPSVASEAARHWLAAHEPALAFDAYLAALDDARATFGFRAQSAILERLVELWPLVPDADARSGLTRARAVIAAAEAADRGGLTSRIRPLLDIAESLLGPDDARGRGELLLLTHSQAVSSGRVTETIAAGLEALDLLAAFEDAAAIAARARVHGNLGGLPSEAFADGAAHAARARAFAAQLGDSDLEAYVRSSLAVDAIEAGDERVPLDLRDFVRSTSFVSPEAELRLTLNTVDGLHRVGRFAEAAELGRNGVARAEELQHGRTWGTLISGNLADSLAAVGALDDARPFAERTLGLAPALDFAAYGLRQLVRLEVLADRLDHAASLLDVHADLVRHPELSEEETRGLRIARAELAVARGEQDVAWDELRPLSDDLSNDFPASEAMYPLFAACEIAAARRAAGARVDEAVGLAHEALAIMPPTPRTARWRAVTDAYAAPTADNWSRAVDAADHASVHRWMLAPVILHHAAALAADGERAPARAAAERALGVARSIGAARDVRRARELQARLTGGGSRGGLLTPRERDVLLLLREGLTNRQIGARLYMSPKTASVHVTALLRKLEVSSRTEAAVRAGSLLDDPAGE
jgi:DNA-binding CsgD family transcriptional regulator